MPRQHAGKLLTALTRSIGRASAIQELVWMKQSLQSTKSPNNSHLEAMLRRRISGEPLQYILGTQPFGPLELLTRPPVLIPRPETEDWAMRLSELLTPTTEKPLSVLDLCTGSGCIPLLLCHSWPSGTTRAYGVDISDHAIRLATENAARCGIPPSPLSSEGSPKSNTYTPYLANILDPSFKDSLPHPFDIITSNPPYIPLEEYRQLPRSVKDFEDSRALLGDLPNTTETDGAAFYRAIARLVAQKGVLAESENAMVVLEVGHKQAPLVRDILHNEAHLHRTEVWRDPFGKERVVIGRR